ncbi:LytR C-terminal domain-containing protein [Pedococcus bigeumensis]|uniref:LytR C-terminal domain-containing protein n=1 Tax=Pedococcus bigeumensis TaxID=433644 RepID=UPI002FED9C49
MNDHRTPAQRWRKHRLRQVMLFVTVPGVLLGTASMTAAYSAGWMTPPTPVPTCGPVVALAPARASFTVNVMNATGRKGVAARVAAGLARRSFSVGDITNAPEAWYVTQTAVVHHGPEGLDQALLTASQIPGATLFADSRAGTSVDVVIGLGYRALGPAPSEVEPAATAGPPTKTVVTVTRPCP